MWLSEVDLRVNEETYFHHCSRSYQKTFSSSSACVGSDLKRLRVKSAGVAVTCRERRWR